MADMAKGMIEASLFFNIPQITQIYADQ